MAQCTPRGAKGTYHSGVARARQSTQRLEVPHDDDTALLVALQRKPAEGDEKKEKGEEAEEEAEPETGHEKTHFHGKSLTNYAGESWLTAPKDKKKENETCFLPKRWMHTWCVSAAPETRRFLVTSRAGPDARPLCWVLASGVATRRVCPRFASSRVRATCCCRRAWTRR